MTGTNRLVCAAVVGIAFLAAPAPTAPVPAGVTDADRFEAALIAAVHLFVERGELDHFKTVLEKHPQLVNERRRFRQPHKPGANDHFTPLQFAVHVNRADVVAYLIQRGAKVDEPVHNGWTPLHVAAREGRLDIVKLLVEGGARTDAKTVALPEREYFAPSAPPGAPQQPVRLPAEPAYTALDVATAGKHADVAAYLKSVMK